MLDIVYGLKVWAFNSLYFFQTFETNRKLTFYHRLFHIIFGLGNLDLAHGAVMSALSTVAEINAPDPVDIMCQSRPQL